MSVSTAAVRKMLQFAKPIDGSLAPMRTEDNTLRGFIKRRLPSPDLSFQLDIEFSFPPGITIIFGPSGAGKTTLLDCIAGLISPDNGVIALGDQVFFDRAEKINLSPGTRRIGYVFQDLGLFPHMTVDDNVQYGIPDLPAAKRSRRSREILESFHIAPLADCYPSKLSGGERQRVALARALVSQPAVLLLDEPLSGLDASIKTRIMKDLCERNCARSIPILYVTHSRKEVFALGEHILVLERGQVVAQGTPDDVMNAPRDEAVAHMAGFENVFDAQIVSTDEHFGVMICQISGTGLILEVPLAHCAPGDRIRVGVRAGDILLASERPQGISARNVFPGRVVSLKRHDYLMEAVVETGTLFRTHLTLGAAQNLRLEVGCSTWILIKTHSCRLLRAANGSAALSDLPIEVVRKPADLDQSEGVSALREVGILSQPTAVPIAAQSESA